MATHKCINNSTLSLLSGFMFTVILTKLPHILRPQNKMVPKRSRIAERNNVL